MPQMTNAELQKALHAAALHQQALKLQAWHQAIASMVFIAILVALNVAVQSWSRRAAARAGREWQPSEATGPTLAVLGVAYLLFFCVVSPLVR